MENFNICAVCGNKNEFISYQENNEVNINEKIILIPYNVQMCPHCKTTFMGQETEDTGIHLIRKIYRQGNDMLEPSELIMWRNNNKLTQEELAYKLNMNVQTVIRYETGKKMPVEISNKLKEVINLS